MVRGGRGYSSRGGGRGSSYRSSGSTYTRIGGSSRKSDFNDSSYRGGGGNSRYTSGGYNSYDSRNRDKFQPRYDNRHDGKRSYRDNSRDRSDDRKRPRQEDSRLNSSYTSTSSYRNRTSRNRASSPNGNYNPRGPSSSYRQREDSASRRHAPVNDSMGPPKRPIRSSYVVRPRGSGTASRARGAHSASGTARGGMRVIRKEASDIRIMRRKLLLARQRDRARLIKIARLTSSLRKRKGPRSSESPSGHKSRSSDKKSDNDDEDEEEDEEMEDEEDEVDEVDEDADEEESGKAKEKRVQKKSSKSSVAKKDGEGDADADDAGKDGEESDKDDENEDEKSIKKEDRDAMDDDDAADGDEDDDKTKEGKNTSLAKSTDGAVDDVKEGKDASKEKKDKERKEDSTKESRRKRNSISPPRRMPYIKLTCVHCRLNCITFKEYTSHLYSRMHKVAMRRVAIRQRVTLARMRTQQRNAQRDIEEKSKEDLDEVKPQFCLLCRLNYRQPKAKHQLSEHHKDMKKFLMPYCQTCRLAFKSPMLYEAHRCSLEHIRRKARSTEANSDVSGDEEKEVDLKNFMTVDSVGEIDDLDDEDLENHLNDDPNLTNKEKVPVGSQFIKKVEAFYCELCRTYNGVKENEESYIKQHCGSRSHLKAFLRHREDESLQAKAERAEKKDHKKKEEAAADTEIKVDAAEEADAEVEADAEAEEVGEDKLWEDVDKDLGDLLREVGPVEHDEEEEEEEDESVLNIDIESEKSKPIKEVNGKKEETTPVAAAPVVEVEKPKKEAASPVVKVKKEKLETKASVKSTPAAKEKDKKPEVAAAE